MTDPVKLIERSPTVDEYQMLRAAVGWPEVDPPAVEIGLAGALYSVCACRADDIIGCGRIVGDGGIYLYLQDVIVLPAHQGTGLGGRIMDALMGYVYRNARRNTFVGLMAARGVVPFYEKYGFSPRPADRPGMFRMWEP